MSKLLFMLVFSFISICISFECVVVYVRVCFSAGNPTRTFQWTFSPFPFWENISTCVLAVTLFIFQLRFWRNFVNGFACFIYSRVVTLSAVWLLQRMFQTHLHQQSPGAVRPVLQADCLAPAERRKRQQRGGRERSSSSYLSPSVSSRCCWLYSSTLWQLHLRERGRYIKRERGRSINAILDAYLIGPPLVLWPHTECGCVREYADANANVRGPL